MGATRGQFVRHAGGFVLVLGIVLGGGVIAAPGADAGAACFGHPATIADHAGTIFGTDGDDVIVGNLGHNTVDGYGGDDLICTGDGDDWVSGGPGKDRVEGGAGEDTLYGVAGKDQLKGGAGDDQLYGDAGADGCQGGGGSDYVDWSCEVGS